MLDKSVRGGTRRLLALPAAVLWVLSFMIPRRGVPINQSASLKTSPLGYLDPLRGFFCIQVLLQHSNSDYHWWIPGWMLSCPYTHFFFRSGQLALQSFFWLSGYVMTYKLVKLASEKKWDAFLDGLASSIFRRYLRLFLPVLPATLTTLTAIKYGVIKLPAHDNIGIDLSKENLIMAWFRDSMHMMNPFADIVGVFDGKRGSMIIKPTWSLCAEFRASITVLAYLLATCKIPRRKRIVLTLCLFAPILYWKSTFTVLALSGMLTAEWRQIKNEKEQASLPAPVMDKTPFAESKEKYSDTKMIDVDEGMLSPQRRASLPSLQTIGLLMIFAYSFVLLRDSRQKEGKAWPLNTLVPYLSKDQQAFVIIGLEETIGALMLMIPIDQLAMLQKPLRTPLAQYLGELSFGIFVCHFPIIHLTWQPYQKWQQGRLDAQAAAAGVKARRAQDVGWIMTVGNLMLIVITLWVAEVFRRMDVHIANFVQWTKVYMWRKN